MISRTRYCTHTIDWDDNIAKSFSSIFHKYKLILVCGVIGSGKSHFIKSVREGPLYTKGYWSAQIILENMFPNMNNFDQTIFEYIRKSEEILIPAALNTERHQLFVEGWYRMPSQRAKLRAYTQAATLCVVLDGPTEAIAHRAIHGHHKEIYTEDELNLLIAQQKATFHWPKKSEGFDQVIYVNTFQEEGRKYFVESTHEG